VEFAIFVHDELDGAGVGVPGGGDRFSQDGGDFGALPVVDRGRRRFFEQLLMAALDAAIALAQNLDVAVLVGQDLEFDVPR
jgi:hypothetical protein